MNKRTFRLVTTLVLLGIAAGGLSFFQLDMKQLRCKVLAYEHIHSGKGLSTLHLSLQEWLLLQDHNEITVNGRQYDVGAVSFEGESVALSVWADNDETAFVDAVRSLWEPETTACGNGSPLHFYNHKFYSSQPKIITAPVWLSFREMLEPAQQQGIRDHQLMPQDCCRIFTPPPEAA